MVVLKSRQQQKTRTVAVSRFYCASQTGVFTAVVAVVFDCLFKMPQKHAKNNCASKVFNHWERNEAANDGHYGTRKVREPKGRVAEKVLYREGELEVRTLHRSQPPLQRSRDIGPVLQP